MCCTWNHAGLCNNGAFDSNTPSLVHSTVRALSLQGLGVTPHLCCVPLELTIWLLGSWMWKQQHIGAAVKSSAQISPSYSYINNLRRWATWEVVELVLLLCDPDQIISSLVKSLYPAWNAFDFVLVCSLETSISVSTCTNAQYTVQDQFHVETTCIAWSLSCGLTMDNEDYWYLLGLTIGTWRLIGFIFPIYTNSIFSGSALHKLLSVDYK